MVTPACQFCDGEPYQCSKATADCGPGTDAKPKLFESFRGAVSTSRPAGGALFVLDPSSISMSCCTDILPHPREPLTLLFS